MGAWGTFDDENDGAHDLFYEFSQDKPLDVKDIKRLSYNLYQFIIQDQNKILAKGDEPNYFEYVGLVLLVLQHIRSGGAKQPSFVDRLNKIGEKAFNTSVGKVTHHANVDTSELERYTISKAQLKDFNKQLLRDCIVAVNWSYSKIAEQKWVDDATRTNALDLERILFQRMTQEHN